MFKFDSDVVEHLHWVLFRFMARENVITAQESYTEAEADELKRLRSCRGRVGQLIRYYRYWFDELPNDQTWADEMDAKHLRA